MRIVEMVLGLALIVITLIDGFEAILQPRRVTHRFRYARIFYQTTWKCWRAAGLLIQTPKRREAFLSIFGPLSLITLFITWVFALIVGFALLQAAAHTPLQMIGMPAQFSSYLYLSGTTFFTLGYGDVTPVSAMGRVLAVIESGLGFGFLAVIVSYLPVLSAASSRREIAISLMDARAGSPPTAAQFLLRLARSRNMRSADALLREWETWSAELLESQLSFPVLAYYRSQHDNQSWLTALATILDSCALMMVQFKEINSYQAQLTFAMARHASVDLALILKTAPSSPKVDRLPVERLEELRKLLIEAGIELHSDAGATARLAELRGMYEPFLDGLAKRFLVSLPGIVPEDMAAADNWQRSRWMRRTPGIGKLAENEHFYGGKWLVVGEGACGARRGDRQW